jgi:hypothetical protein
MKNVALKVSGVFFLLVATLHLVRVLWKIPVVVSGIVMPLYLSMVAAVVAFLLAIWMFVVSE